MVELRCDICRRPLAPTDREMPTMKDHFQSVKITWNMTGGTKSVDLCTKCEKRMIKYLRKEAKMDGDVNATPTVDAVPVVRCKECKRFSWHTEEYAKQVGYEGACWICGMDMRKATDYCSYGKRWEDAEVEE